MGFLRRLRDPKNRGVSLFHGPMRTLSRLLGHEPKKRRMEEEEHEM